jgi:hypothetical protein
LTPGIEISILSSKASPSEESQPKSTGVPVHNFPTQDLFSSKGYYRLPFFNCGERIYNFSGLNTTYTDLSVYLKLRQLGCPEKWSHLDGTAAPGQFTAMEMPEISLGTILAGRLSALQQIKRHWIVIVMKAKLQKWGPIPMPGTADKKSAVIEDDYAYKWVRFSSGERARAGLQDVFSGGYGVVASWAEVEAADVQSQSKFDGRKVDDEYFAIVGMKD